MQESTPTIEDRRYEGYKSFLEGKEKLESYPEVQTWLKTVSKRSSDPYLRALNKFCNWCKKDPHQLIIERDKEKKNPDPNARIWTRNLVLDFRKHLEEEGYAPKSINAMDGAIRGFYSAILGREGMINIGNYPYHAVGKRRDLIPTLDELKRMIDVSDIATKFSIIFLAQTGMRPEDALNLRIGDIQRELEQDKCPLAITFLPEKDKNRGIGERITFLASDGVKVLKQYLEWRKKKDENITLDSPLFVARSKRYGAKSVRSLSKRNLNERIRQAADKAGITNGNGKYGRIRTYSLRKFFITQLTNHGLEDKLVNFFCCHKVPEVDLVYWSRRVEQLREIYKQREKFLNPIVGDNKPSLDEIDKKIDERLKEFVKNNLEGMCSEAIQKILKDNNRGNSYIKSVIVKTENEVVKFSNKGFECQVIGENKWLMKKQLAV